VGNLSGAHLQQLEDTNGNEPTLLQQRQQVVIEELEIKCRAQQETQARKAELESQLSKTQERVNRLKKEREEALKKLNELRAMDILKVITLSEQEKKEISQTLKDLGVTRSMKNAAELMQGADELRVVLERGNAIITPLRERGGKGGGAKNLALLQNQCKLSQLGKLIIFITGEMV
jgi:DNA gyrase/topoisomerase IV subunit A